MPKAPRTKRREHWKEEPDEHDYPAAGDYVSLLWPPSAVIGVVRSLKAAPIERRKAKDLLRASRLALLPETSPYVRKDLLRVKRGERLSPVLLVRGTLAADVALTVADGYHRICASYHLDEDADIPCRIADAPRPTATAGTRRPAVRPAQATSARAPGSHKAPGGPTSKAANAAPDGSVAAGGGAPTPASEVAPTRSGAVGSPEGPAAGGPPAS